MARQVADVITFAPGANADPVRAINPFTPNQLVTDGSSSEIPIIGIVALAGLVLLFEHLRRRRGGK